MQNKNYKYELTKVLNRLLAHLAINRRHGQIYAISITSHP